MSRQIFRGRYPLEINTVVIGAGITGLHAAQQFLLNGNAVVLLERSNTIGGVWSSQANRWSRVNTSEPAYRPRASNESTAYVKSRSLHPSASTVLGDLNDIAADNLKSRIRLQVTVNAVEKADGSDVFYIHYDDHHRGCQGRLKANRVLVCVNRRIGNLRLVNFPGEDLFEGYIHYGVSNNLQSANFAGRSVLIVGGGAFAAENARNAIECGARKVVVLSRRRGTVSNCRQFFATPKYTLGQNRRLPN